MSSRFIILSIGTFFIVGAGLTLPKAQARYSGPEVETEYARIVDGAGFGFCKVTRIGRRIRVRVHVAGMDFGSIGTAWIFINGKNIGQLDGTVATESGDVFLRGSFNAPRGAEIKIDVRDHRVSIRSIGNLPNDDAADEALVRELTTPAAFRMGTCVTQFERKTRL